jgi:hypothetical protein
MYFSFPRSFQRICSISRPCVIFIKNCFYCEELLAPRPTPKLDDHHLSAVRDCLFKYSQLTLHIWRQSPPPATRGLAMPWWQEHIQHAYITVQSHNLVFFCSKFSISKSASNKICR